MKDNIVKEVIPVPELDTSNLEFVKEIWRGGKSSELVLVNSSDESESTTSVLSGDPTKIATPPTNPPFDLELVHFSGLTTQHETKPMDIDFGADSTPVVDNPDSLVGAFHPNPHPSDSNTSKRKSHNDQDADYTLEHELPALPKRQCNTTTQKPFSEESQSSTMLQHQTTPSPASFTSNMAQLNAAALQFANGFNLTAASLFSDSPAHPASTSTTSSDALSDAYATLSDCLHSVAKTLTNTSSTPDTECSKTFVKTLLDVLKMCSGLVSSSEGNDFCALAIQTVRSICTSNRIQIGFRPC